MRYLLTAYEIIKTLLQLIAVIIVFAGAAVAVIAFGVILFIGIVQLFLSAL